MWPFRKRVPNHASFPIGPYVLNMNATGLSGLRELSEQEYRVFPKEFQGEKIYHGPPVEFLSLTWDTMLGVVNGTVYKIAPSFQTYEKNEANNAAMAALAYCSSQLGEPASQRTGFFVWDTVDGNIILQTAETHEGLSVNLFLTSSSIKGLPRNQ